MIATDQLLAEGYIQTRVGSGTFVTLALPTLPQTKIATPYLDPSVEPPLSAWGQKAKQQAAAIPVGPPPPEIDFRYGFAPPDPDLLEWWRRAVHRAFDHTPLDYGDAQGLPDLRSRLSEHLALHRGVQCSPEQVMVVGGSQQALNLVARVLINPGDPVLIEEPHYQGARAVFRAAEADLIGLPVDQQGLEITARTPSARLAYVTPSHQFPTGAVLSLTRRLALLDWAERNNALILEDDYDSEYRYEGRPIEAVQGLDRRGRTLYMGTFSKVLFPALRLGFLVLPPSLVSTFRAAKWLSDRHSSMLEQVALSRFIKEGLFERHLRRMRTRHAARRRALIGAVGQSLENRVEVMGTESGIHLVFWIDEIEPNRSEAFIQAALLQGVGLYPIAPYYLSPPNRTGFLMGYGALEIEAIQEGIQRLAKLLETWC